VLRAEFAGAEHEWEGRIVRTEGEIDPKSRMVHAVARVADPYGHTEGRPPLAVGLFVQAEILGITVEGVAVIPRAAVRNGNQVLLVDTEDRLRFREIDILRKTQHSVIVRGGLTAGERVGVSPIAAVTDGMRVRVAAEERGPS
jgi:multidrug efflux pump subunit AcrA (membrane-fusion protein)